MRVSSQVELSTKNFHDEFMRPLLWSTVIHLLVFLIFTVKTFFWDEKPEPYQAAIKVDLIALPDKVVAPPVQNMDTQAKEDQSLKNKVKEKNIEKEKSIEPEIVLKAKKKEVKDKNDHSKMSASEAIDKIKKKLAIDKIKEDLKSQERQELSQKLTNKINQYKGNVLSPGTELTGIMKLQHENYLNQIDRHVKNFWSLPEWLAKGQFKAQIKIQIDNQGLLVNAQLIKSSGNSNYDDRVLETVKQAVPFPVPPEKLQEIVKFSGVVLGFPE